MTPSDREARRRRILAVYAETGSIRATVRRTRYSIHTIRRVLRGPSALPAAGAAPPRSAPPPRPSQLDPFRPVISRLVLDDRLTAVLILEELRGLGYRGGYSILKDYVRRIRPAPKVRVTTVLEHPPGREAQVDWSPYRVLLGGETRVVHGFSLVLPFSRFMVVRFALDQTLETLCALHVEAFEEMGAVPPTITYDNMTAVGRHIGGEGEVALNRRFEAFAKDWGFEIALISPGRPNEHASVERPFHYIEHNCLPRRRGRFEGLDDLNRHAKDWLARIANVRVHGTTRERPVDRFARERAFLLPLRGHRPEPQPLATLSRKVGSDFSVAVETHRYSVPPAHVGRAATVSVFAERVEVRVGGDLVAVHARAAGRHGRHVLPEHEDDFKKATPSRRLLEQAFLRLGPAAKDYYEGLVTQRGRGAGYHLQRILRLADRYGTGVVLGAMAHAARYGNYSADATARVIAGRALRESTAAASSSDRTREPRPADPERARRWLEGLHVETRELGDYDRLIARKGTPERRDATAANPSPTAEPATKGDLFDANPPPQGPPDDDPR